MPAVFGLRSDEEERLEVGGRPAELVLVKCEAFFLELLPDVDRGL
jgi:hypothetical protein